MYNLTVDTAHTFFVGEGQWLVHNAGCWDVGDQIDKVDEAGNYPDWDTVRSRYWQNRAATSSGEFGPQNLALMASGYAPVARIIAQVKKTGATVEKLVTKELHHISGRNIRNPHNINNLAELWPWEHAARDPFRRLDYKFLRFK